MNKLSALALGAAFALSVPLAVSAQDSGIGVDLGGDAQIGVDLGVDASAHSYSDLMTALEASGTADLSGIDATTDIEIVAISTLSSDDSANAEAFADARTTFDADISALQGDIAAHADVTAALEAEGYTAQDVVAVWTQADGSVTVFVDA